MHIFLFTVLTMLTWGPGQSAPQSKEPFYLDRSEYVVADTGKNESFHLHLINTTDSLVIIEDVRPSCGCILATTQRTVASKELNADIYIGFITAKVSSTQPITVDVYTNRNRTTPLRLYIRKKTAISRTKAESK